MEHRTLTQPESIASRVVERRRIISLDIALSDAERAAYTMLELSSSEDETITTRGIGLDIGSKFTALCAMATQQAYDWTELHRQDLEAIPLAEFFANTTGKSDDKKEETLIAIPAASIDGRVDSKLPIEGVKFGSHAEDAFRDKRSRNGYHFFTNFKQTIQTGSNSRAKYGQNLYSITVPSLTIAGESRAFIPVIDLISLCVHQAVIQGIQKTSHSSTSSITKDALESTRLCLTVPDSADNAVTEFMRSAALRVKFKLSDGSVGRLLPNKIIVLMESIASGMHAFHFSNTRRMRLLDAFKKRLDDCQNLNEIGIKRFRAREKHLFKFVHLDVGAGTHDVAVFKSEIKDGHLDDSTTAHSSFGGNLGGDVIECAVLSFLLKNVFCRTGINQEYLEEHPEVEFRLLAQLREMKKKAFKCGFPMLGMNPEEVELQEWSVTFTNNLIACTKRNLGDIMCTHFPLKLTESDLPKEFLAKIEKKKLRSDVNEFKFGFKSDDDVAPLLRSDLQIGHTIEIESCNEGTHVLLPFRLIFLAAAWQAEKITSQLEECIRSMKVSSLNNKTGDVAEGTTVYPDAIFMSGSGSMNTLLRNRIEKYCEEHAKTWPIKFVEPPMNSTHCVKGAAHCALLPNFLQNSTFEICKSYAVLSTYNMKGVYQQRLSWVHRKKRKDEEENPWGKISRLGERLRLDQFDYVTPIRGCQKGDTVTMNVPYYVADFEGNPIIYEIHPKIENGLEMKVCVSDTDKFTSLAEKVMLTNAPTTDKLSGQDKEHFVEERKIVRYKYHYTNTSDKSEFAKVSFRFLLNGTFLVCLDFVEDDEEGRSTGRTFAMEMTPIAQQNDYHYTRGSPPAEIRHRNGGRVGDETSYARDGTSSTTMYANVGSARTFSAAQADADSASPFSRVKRIKSPKD